MQSSRVTRRWLLLASLSAPVAVCAQSLIVRRSADFLRVTAPQLHFLSGKSLERLRNGAAVGFLTQLTLSTDAHVSFQQRALEHFIVSYDLWEEKFSVVRRGRAGRSVSHLSAPAAEAWCLDQMQLPTSGLSRDRQFWVRLEIRAEDPKEEAGVVGEQGINLTRLIEIFSRPPRNQQPHVMAENGPLRLSELQ